jgi:predicted dehydrogenase
MSMSRYLAGADPTKVISAKADTNPKFPQVDLGTTATLAFPTPGESTADASAGVTASLLAHFRLPPVLGFLPAWPKMSVRVSGTHGTAELSNFPGAWAHHTITVVSSEQEGGRSQRRKEKHYGNLGWTTWVSSRTVHPPRSDFDNMRRYRYQLEAFVDKVRGRTPQHWYDAQDSIANMEWIEAVYKEVSRRFFLP